MGEAFLMNHKRNIERRNIPEYDTSGSPGSAYLIAGDMQAGYFGRVPSSSLYTGIELASAVGLTKGTEQNNSTDWLKFAYQGKILFRPMKAIRHTISWDNIDDVGCALGTKTVSKNGLTYKVRLMKGSTVAPAITENNSTNTMKNSEWNKLMLPIHVQASTKAWSSPSYVEDDVSNWNIGFTDSDLLTLSAWGYGSAVWCQEVSSISPTYRITRGRIGVSYASHDAKTTISSSVGWCPILELVQ